MIKYGRVRDDEEFDEDEIWDAVFEEEYYTQCGYRLVKEITKFDYNLAIMEG